MIVAVLDACCLYPPSLRDLLLRIASVEAFEPRWSATIQSEWTRNVLKDNPLLPEERLFRTRQIMEQAFPSASISNYESLIPGLTLPDPNDRHVLATAICARAAFIVTFNRADFPDAVTRSHGTEAIHPDKFLKALMELDPDRFLRGVRRHRSDLKRPPKSPRDYVDTLRANRLFELALQIEANLGSI